MEEFFFTGQRKIVRRKLVKTAIYFLIIGLFIGIGLGQWWRYAQVEPGYQSYISELNKKIEFYRENYVPIKPNRKGAR